ncbi:Outer membrane protein OmpA [Kordiimonas lacus]|jgi:hypothetical protein|uniref:Outer membrane protein OmpA n=2 Tax=Kordiimonadaceae TaxID=1331809 RepID=A0A1G6W0D5_9PROT|nr:Outer membrane protein OmpA [Kordiimonas lacus]
MFSEEQDSKRIFGADNTMGLFVALYLILLAFFIILTALSTHAASRGSLAMESVNQTFTRSGEAKIEDIDPRAATSAAEDPVLKAIQQRFFSELEIPGRFSEAGGGAFEIQFPESYLFEPGSINIRRDMAPFVDQLVEALGDVSSGGRQEVAFMFGTGRGAVAREMTRSQEVAVRRAGALARYLQTSGLERDVFTTGFVGIPEGEILAVFTRTLDRNTRNKLGEGGGRHGN